jgi:hypothetical protein
MANPEDATPRPPKPFSGIGTYSRATHRLTGSLAVQFAGLKLRLGSADAVANLVDEAGPAEPRALRLGQRRSVRRSIQRTTRGQTATRNTIRRIATIAIHFAGEPSSKKT